MAKPRGHNTITQPIDKINCILLFLPKETARDWGNPGEGLVFSPGGYKPKGCPKEFGPRISWKQGYQDV